MYASKNYKTGKALREAVKLGPVPCFQPGPFGSTVVDGHHCCEGPHYPQPHKWYVGVVVKDGNIVSTKN